MVLEGLKEDEQGRQKLWSSAASLREAIESLQEGLSHPWYTVEVESALLERVATPQYRLSGLCSGGYGPGSWKAFGHG